MIAGLPYDAEVEYLESTGTQYIDTGFVATGGCIIECSFCALEYGTQKVIAGSHSRSATNSYNRNQIIISNTRRVDFNKCEKYGGFGTSADMIGYFHEYYFNSISYNRIGKVDGVDLVSETTVGVLSPDTNVVLMMNQYDNSKTSGRVAWCRIYDSGNILVRDYIPIRVGTEGCLYDRVTRRIFRNAGTGAFVRGPDVARPVMGLHFMRRPRYTAKDYVQMGLVAMWDGIENAGWGVHDQNAVAWKDLRGTSDWGLLTNIGTQNAFEVGADYVKILSGVNYRQDAASPYGGNGHCIPSWSADGDIRQMEIVLDNTDFSVTATARICAFGVGGGNINSQMAIRDGNLFQFQYNKYPLLQLRAGLNAISFDRDTARGLFNGVLTDSAKTTVSSGYVYSPPVLGAYAAQAAIGIKIKALRIYSRVLTEAEMLANYAVDKERFNLP